MDHYKYECPRAKYLHKLVQYVQTTQLPFNFDGARGEKTWNQKIREFEVSKPAILESCRKRREMPL